MRWKPLVTGILALIILEVLVSTPAGPVAGLFAIPGKAAARLIDPTIPLIPGKTSVTGAPVHGTFTVAPAAPDAPLGPPIPSPAVQLLPQGAKP